MSQDASHVMLAVGATLRLNRFRAMPISDGYRGNLFTAGRYFPYQIEKRGMLLRPGTSTRATLRVLIHVGDRDVFAAGTDFEMREGPNIVGHGTITAGEPS